MTLSWEQITERLLASLPAGERETSVVYLDERFLPPGAAVQIDGEETCVPWPAAVAFVDLEPEANWAHDCRYLLIHAETGEYESIAARFPPFLRGVPETLRVIWRGKAVPPWAVMHD